MRTLVTAAALVSIAHTFPNPARAQGVPPLAVDAAPQRIVYEVFFEAVAAWDRRASDPGLPAAQRDQVRDRMREVVGLEVSSYQVVKSVAYRLVASLEQNNRRADAIIRNPELSAPDRQNALAKLRLERDAAINAAVEQLREYLGPAGFQGFDQRVRGHIVPRLRIRSLPGSSRQGKAGGK